MPIVIAYGISEEISGETLKTLRDKIRKTVAEVKELSLRNRKQISVFFPAERLKTGLAKEIIVFVKGLFIKPERNEEVRQDLADRLKLLMAGEFPEIVEVFIEPFDPINGFSAHYPPDID